MNVLIGCERSGVIRDEFARRGHHSVSCDLEPSRSPNGHHIQADIFIAINEWSTAWDLLIVHPECRYLSGSGLHWNKRRPGRAQKTEDALEFVRRLLDTDVPKLCLENPVGCIGTRIRPATQYIQPYEFGEDASKKTGLWLKGLPKLVPTQYVEPRIVNGKPRWANQTDSGQNRLGPSDDRAMTVRREKRARTYVGIAKAMAEQWG